MAPRASSAICCCRQADATRSCWRATHERARGGRMSAVAPRAPLATARMLLRGAWERVAVYLPIILMGFMAMGTYWLARNTPSVGPGEAQRALTHDPDYFMRGFSVKTFDANGRLKSQVHGAEARHYPDTDTLEIDQPRLQS